jgi:zinc-binding alcohol dehydrogenase family protein
MRFIEAYYNSVTQGQDFRVVDREEQPLGERDIRVSVKAISANPVDYKVAGSIKSASSEPKVLGYDASGVVTEVGAKVRQYRVGDEVYYSGAVQRSGSNAQSQAVDERIVGAKPKSLTHKEAAAIPLTAVTAWEAIFDQLGFPRDSKRSVLILGAAGGVGSIAIQLLRNLTQAVVIGTASRPESQKWAQELGADHVIDHCKDITAQLKEIGHPEVDFILCFNDTDMYFPKFAEWLKPFGKVTSIVENRNPIELGLLKSKSLSFSWEFMFTRSLFQTPDMDEQRLILNEVSKLIDSGKVRTTLGLDLGDMNISNIKKAHELLKSGKAIGKLVMGELKN